MGSLRGPWKVVWVPGIPLAVPGASLGVPEVMQGMSQGLLGQGREAPKTHEVFSACLGGVWPPTGVDFGGLEWSS